MDKVKANFAKASFHDAIDILREMSAHFDKSHKVIAATMKMALEAGDADKVIDLTRLNERYLCLGSLINNVYELAQQMGYVPPQEVQAEQQSKVDQVAEKVKKLSQER